MAAILDWIMGGPFRHNFEIAEKFNIIQLQKFCLVPFNKKKIVSVSVACQVYVYVNYILILMFKYFEYLIALLIQIFILILCMGFSMKKNVLFYTIKDSVL